MHSPALAIGWAFARRHRWGVIATFVYLLALTVMKVINGFGYRPTFQHDETFALVVIVPLSACLFYFLSAFTFGLEGDIAARESIYPRRMLTLPVTTAALAAWPMFYGSVVMALLWVFTRILAPWPAGVDIPVFWPLLLAPSLLAWSQALTWMPYPLRGMRVIATVLWLIVFEAHVFTAMEMKVSESVMIALLLPHLPLAYLVARFGVGKARRGDVPDWGRVFARPDRARRQDNFTSAARAQEWFEWRQHGRSLPWLMAILLPCELVFLWLFRETPILVYELLVLVLLTPPFMAVFVAATVSAGVTPFIAARPLTNTSLIGAKLRVTIWSTLVTWLMVLVAVPIALKLSGTWPLLLDHPRRFAELFGTPRAVVLAMLTLVILMTSTWKQLVQSLCIGMSGREWLVKGSVFGALTLLAILFPLALWILQSKRTIVWFLSKLPEIFAVMACLKLVSAVWIAARLHDARLMRDRTLIAGAVSWSVLVFALYGVMFWIVPAMLVRSYFVALIAILVVPLARLSAAPLALAWSRHS